MLCFFPSKGRAQDREIFFQQYTTKQGLSQNDINCLFQDSRGVIWVGTNDGFSSFDGYEFKSYRMDTHGIPSNLVNKIFEDSYGNLWIATADAGVIRFNLGTELFDTFLNTDKNPKFLTSNSISEMIFDADGNLWLGNHKGLNCIKKEFLTKETVKVSKYYNNPHNHESLRSNYVTALYVDKSGDLWVGTKRGLQKFIKPTEAQQFGTFKSYLKEGENGVLSIVDKGKSLMLAYFDGIFELKIKNEKSYRLSKQSDIKCETIIIDDTGVLWGGASNGLLRMKQKATGDTLEILGHYRSDIDNGLKSNIISDLLKDNIGIIWIGTNGGGISKYNPRKKPFKHVKRTLTEGSLSYNKVRALYEDEKEQLWVGTEGGGINILNAANKFNYDSGFQTIRVAADKRSQNVVYSITEWDDKMILGLGYPTKSASVSTKNLNNITEQIINNKFHPKWHVNAVFTTEVDNNSMLWMGSYGGGLLRGIRKENGDIEWTKIPLGASDDDKEYIEIVRSVFVDRKGNLWVGTNEGLCLISKEEKLKEYPKFKLFQSDASEASLSYNYVMPIFEASNGEIWVGTMGGGLNIISPSSNNDSYSITHLSTKHGLPSNVIKAILEDDYGNLWVSSNRGLSKIDLETRSVKNFDETDGLQDDEFGELAALKRKNGELLFGGVDGITVFRPHEIVDDNTIAELIFTNLKVLNVNIEPHQEFQDNVILNKSIHETESIKLLHNQNSFSINFASLHYASPGNNHYKYKLVGFDQDWVNIDASQREAKYTNISPGSYQLLVKASNSDNVWNPKAISLQIEILQPWWLSWYAKLSYVTLFFILISFFSRYTIITARKKSQLEMEKFEREKLEDLSQLKLQFFTNISHELRTPLTLIHTPVEQLIKKGRNLSEHDREKSYQLIFKNVQHLMRLVNQLLDFRKVEQGKMKLELSKNDWTTFVEQVYHSFKELAEHENIDFNYKIEGDKHIRGYMDTDKLEKILYNLLSNAFKFTYQGEINLSIRKEGDYVKISLQDTGIGISEEKQKDLFNRFYQVSNLKKAKHRGTGIGLAFSKSLVELHHGTIVCESEENKGTTFHLTFPLSAENYEGEIENIEAEIIEDDLSQDEQDDLEVSAKPKIVVVDDNYSIRELLKGLLEDSYDVFLAEDGGKALSLAKEVMPNLVLADIMMPVMDGYELTKTIREDNQLCHLPIVLLTAKNSEESKLKGYEYGVDAYVTKPFNTDVLLARIHALIENRHNQQKRFRTNVDIQPSEITFTSIDEKFLNRLVAIVEENISDSEFTVEKLALEYGATPLRLNQKLKALTGQTAKGFIRNIRLKRAAQMLKLGRYNVSDVTYEVGFNDLKYFRNCFKKEFGIPPSHYLKENLTDSDDTPVLEIEEIQKDSD